MSAVSHALSGDGLLLDQPHHTTTKQTKNNASKENCFIHKIKNSKKYYFPDSYATI
jgi:hypothetical protein